MRERPGTLQRIILSPGVSLLVALSATLFMTLRQGEPWFIPVATLAASFIMIQAIKGETLFRGVYLPLAGLMQAAVMTLPADAVGLAMLATALAGYITLSFCFLRPKATRTIFTIYLMFGCGMLWQSCFAYLAATMLPVMLLMRSFSLRGLTAALLGVLTPAILILPFAPDYASGLLAAYAIEPTFGHSAPLLAVSAVAIAAALASFLPTYGYPAKARARNMSMIALTVCSVALAFIDFGRIKAYTSLICLCGAYNLTHLASLKRNGWIYAVLALAVFITLTIKYT